MLFQNRVVSNKFYRYANHLVKIKKISKTSNRITLLNLQDNTIIEIPLKSSDLLLKRIYTVGEVAKIVDRQPNTLRKYEKKNLIASPKNLVMLIRVIKTGDIMMKPMCMILLNFSMVGYRGGRSINLKVL